MSSTILILFTYLTFFFSVGQKILSFIQLQIILITMGPIKTSIGPYRCAGIQVQLSLFEFQKILPLSLATFKNRERERNRQKVRSAVSVCYISHQKQTKPQPVETPLHSHSLPIRSSGFSLSKICFYALIKLNYFLY